MNDELQKENPPALDRNTFLAEIERLYIEGYKTRQIAQLLRVDGNKVGRNLREIKRRWDRAAGRQRAALSQTQCAAVYREAMSGWRRSQQPKLTTTEHRDADGKPVKTTIRRQEGPGDKTFLQAAASALKALRQFAPDPNAAKPSRDARSWANTLLVELLHIMTPDQVNDLSNEQVVQFRAAINARRKELRERREQAEARRDLEDGQEDPACLHSVDQGTPACELPPREGSRDSGPDGGEEVPSRDSPQAAAAPQDQADGPPLPAELPEGQPERGGLRAAEESAARPVAETAVPADSSAAAEAPEHASRAGQASDGPRSGSASLGPATNDPPVTNDPAGRTLASPLVPLCTARPDACPSPVLFGGPRTGPPTAAEHQAYQQWLAQLYGLGCYNIVPAQGSRQTPVHAPPVASLVGRASTAQPITLTESISQ